VGIGGAVIGQRARRRRKVEGEECADGVKALAYGLKGFATAGWCTFGVDDGGRTGNPVRYSNLFLCVFRYR
jgi:hypothetical protein